MMKIFVGNLSYQTTQDDLQAAFAAYGTVEQVSIVTDRDTGQPRGFAFVEMTNRSEAEAAITNLNGAEMNGRAGERERGSSEAAGDGGLGEAAAAWAAVAAADVKVAVAAVAVAAAVAAAAETAGKVLMEMGGPAERSAPIDWPQGARHGAG